MATVTHAREAVIQALYAREQGGDNWDLLLLELIENKKLKGKKRELALELWEGVLSHLSEIDKILKEVLVGWELDRLDKVNKQILRLGIYEMAFKGTPYKIAISEGVKLAETFSEGKGRGFVNGVLHNTAKHLGLIEKSSEETEKGKEAGNSEKRGGAEGDEVKTVEKGEESELSPSNPTPKTLF